MGRDSRSESKAHQQRHRGRWAIAGCARSSHPTEKQKPTENGQEKLMPEAVEKKEGKK